MQITSLEKTIYSENQALKDVVHRGQALRREGKDFVFSQFTEGKKKKSKKDYSPWYAVGVLSFLLVFTVLFPLSHWRILCHPTD
jgi:nucleoside permease NupC